MVDYQDFSGMCDRVARVTGRINEDERKIYYEAVKGFRREVVARGMKLVTRMHGYYRFPTLAEVLDAIKDSEGEGKIPVPVVCGLCNMTGLVLTQVGKYAVVYRCSCENGRHVARNIRPYAEVKDKFDPPYAGEDRPLEKIGVVELMAMDPKSEFPEGIEVEKACETCWTGYSVEHKRPVTAGALQEFHRSPGRCGGCFEEEGRRRGMWK